MNKSPKILIIENDRKASASIISMLTSFTPEVDQIKTWDERTDLFQSRLDYELIILGPSFTIDNNDQQIQNIKIFNPQVTIVGTYKSTPRNGQDRTSPFVGVHHYKPSLDQDNFQDIINQALIERKDCRLWKDIPVIIGNSREINDLRKNIKEVAQKDIITVLITGETGTGKELIARSIHFYSKRKNGPLIKINCGSLPDDLLESEVFGFQKGAFTGAHRDKPGRFELSHEGTLFIDEIGNLSLPLQAKFLQVLEEKSFSRLGGTEEQTVDTRVVAATNSDLSTMVREGTFRKDLFFRLNILNIKAWPLRELKEDIPLLVHYFVNKFCFELKRNTIEVPNETMALMQAYHWPGNVRELENTVRSAIVYKNWNFFAEEMSKRKMESQGNETDGQLRFEKEYGDLSQFFKDNNYLLKQISKNYVAKVEKEAILKSLQATDWNRRQAAKLLGVSYKTLLNRISDLDLSK